MQTLPERQSQELKSFWRIKMLAEQKIIISKTMIHILSCKKLEFMISKQILYQKQ